jgi:hypothetical protein
MCWQTGQSLATEVLFDLTSFPQIFSFFEVSVETALVLLTIQAYFITSEVTSKIEIP